jgi:uncharacterized repeat protein (TIGR01451 family)
MTNSPRKPPFLVVLLALSLAGLAFGPNPAAPAPQMEVVPGREVILRVDDRLNPFQVPPPEQAELGIQSATIQVNWNPATCSGATSTWPDNAKTAFSYAASIWASLINSSVPVEVNACWRSDLGSGVLGSAGPVTYYRNFSGAPFSNTWYPTALANALSNTDLNQNDGWDSDGDGLDRDAEIFANFSSVFSWYFGTDGNPGSNLDFASVVLHELGHGLGFLGSMQVSGGSGSWGYGSGYPFVYDRFTEDNSGIALLNTGAYPNPSAALGSALTSNAVYFNGATARAANGGSRVSLYAPNPWQSGSSYSHLAQSFDNTPNALMTYSLAYGEAIHSPGPVTLGIFKDTGWTVNETQPQPDLTISQQVSGGRNPGDAVTITLTVQNVGNATAAGVTVTDILPAEVEDEAYSASFAGITKQTGTTFVWDLPNLAAGFSGAITITGQMSNSLPPGFSLANTATVATSTAESTTANNSSTAVIGTHYQYLPLILNQYTPPPEGELISLINAQRTSRGLGALTPSSLIAHVAEAHSQDMITRNFFSHTNPDGLGPGQRLTNAGYNWRTYGETIGGGYTSPQAMLTGWMNSAGHRAILLGSAYTEIGLGYVPGGAYGHYWTALLAAPR